MTVTVCRTEEETATLLATVLDSDHTAASLLARAIHQDSATVADDTNNLTVPLDPSELGIWIDPIGEIDCRSDTDSGPQQKAEPQQAVCLLFLTKMPPANT